MAFDPVTLGAAVQLAKDPATIKASVEDWLDDHPEATTTVKDGSITKAKLHDDLADEIEQNTTDVGVLKSAINNLDGDMDDVKEAIGTVTESSTETTYLPVTIKSRWNNSSTPSSSNAFARSTNVIERTSAMQKIVAGTGYVLAKVMGSNDGTNYTILNIQWGLSEFDISSNTNTYLTVDIQKPQQQNFTSEDDVSQAIGIVSATTVQVMRDLGADVGENADLETTAKTTLVDAINEVNTKASAIPADSVARDAIGYVVTGETTRDITLILRKRFNPSSGEIGNDTTKSYGEFTKLANDIGIKLNAKNSTTYYIGAIYYSTDNWTTFTNYGQIDSFHPNTTSWNLSAIPVGAAIRVNIYKPSFADFSTDEDLSGVMDVVSNTLTIRDVECVNQPADIIGKLLNDARANGETLNIKLLGDSITHGVGSTGFNGAAVTAEPDSYDFTVTLLNQTYYVTRSTGTASWAAKFATYMTEKYGATVVNNGVSGGDADMIIDSWDNLVSATDDLIICMIGTNDRLNYNDANLKNTFRLQLETIQHKADLAGIPIIFMSEPPVSVYYETHTADGVSHTLTMHAEDIENIVHLVSQTEHNGYVSMFTGVLDYADYRNIDFNTLLSDQLHPNDAGYTVMYDILMRSFSLGRKVPGATW